MGIETFKSRARVIDLLGRQQIADAPTATGELFKNALDAGASHVQVDYVDPENSQGIGFLRISDNGLGMRLQEDVVGKWLVLATESKFAKKADGGCNLLYHLFCHRFFGDLVSVFESSGGRPTCRSPSAGRADSIGKSRIPGK